MSTITIKHFAQQIGIEPERLVKQLNDAGISGKSVDDSLVDEEKRKLLEFLRGPATPAARRPRGRVRWPAETGNRPSPRRT